MVWKHPAQGDVMDLEDMSEWGIEVERNMDVSQEALHACLPSNSHSAGVSRCSLVIQANKFVVANQYYLPSLSSNRVHDTDCGNGLFLPFRSLRFVTFRAPQVLRGGVQRTGRTGWALSRILSKTAVSEGECTQRWSVSSLRLCRTFRRRVRLSSTARTARNVSLTLLCQCARHHLRLLLLGNKPAQTWRFMIQKTWLLLNLSRVIPSSFLPHMTCKPFILTHPLAVPESACSSVRRPMIFSQPSSPNTLQYIVAPGALPIAPNPTFVLWH